MIPRKAIQIPAVWATLRPCCCPRAMLLLVAYTANWGYDDIWTGGAARQQDSMTQGNSWLSKKHVSEGPVFMVYQKPEAWTQQLTAMIFCKESCLATTQGFTVWHTAGRTPGPQQQKSMWWRDEKDKGVKCICIFLFFGGGGYNGGGQTWKGWEMSRNSMHDGNQLKIMSTKM